jgi:phosphoesterase RecJ-like protein
VNEPVSPLDPEISAEVLTMIAKWRRPLLLSHTKPDGDAIGALTAMRSFFRARGVEPLAVQFDPTPPRYRALRQGEPIPVLDRDAGLQELADVDGVVVLDTCTYNQLAPVEEWLKASPVPKLVIDHHVTRDDLADVYLIDDTAASTCLILYEWARQLDLPLNDEVCRSLFVGIATDTGWFRHANTDARTLHAAAELAERGVDVHDMFRQLYQADSEARLRIAARLLDSMELYAQSRLAVISIGEQTIDQLGGRMSDTEDMINEPLRIRSVQVSVMLVEQHEGPIRASFRSKPPINEHETDVDVAAVAQHFGGGGHRRASGARIPGTLAEVRSKVVGYLQEILQ